MKTQLPNLQSIRSPRLASGIALALGLFAAVLAPQAKAAQSTQFALKPGDRVCFYGDSITEQRFYGMDVEAFVRTRYPGLKVEFVNSGVGGDKVTGGWAGGIDTRLERDVFPFKPNVVTIMLGMNDASYRPFDQKIFDVYRKGYEHIIESLQQHLPGVRIVLIQPTPYDDVTKAPFFPGGYNAVLLRYSAFVRELAARHHLECVDFMTPLLNVLTKAQAENPKLAGEVLPGRIHPSPVGELVMAQALLKAWNASPTVTAVTIDGAAHQVVSSENTTVSDLSRDGASLSWTQHDDCLPFPILGLHEQWKQFPPTERDWGSLSFFTPAPKPDWSHTDPAAALMIKLSHFYRDLDQQTLKVRGLPAAQYALSIDGKYIGTFESFELAGGINLANYETPMMNQAWHVLDLCWKHTAWRFFAWRGIQTQLAFDKDPSVQAATTALVDALHNQELGIEKREVAAAQPRVTHYRLSIVSR
ncbi:GDSL-like lipase/acylhydrolase [mine drainage metagenome]|uniref:GDSL-like lipase/acylhydrolase n=1 Tax=mine drainage metagenome TaxID=410659 RepID=A0A1J5TIU5_9ZZZZ